MGRINRVAICLAGGFGILSAPLLADTKAGVDAWTRGDFAGAVREWQAAAGKGDADALFNLGQAYRLGKGVAQDNAKAEELFGRAAGLGHLQAADNYGLMLFQRGDQARAIPYITGAAGRGDPRAQYLLGIAHFNGQLVAKDWVRAYALVSLAQQQGIGPATAALKQMDSYIPLEQRQQAVQLSAQLQSQADANRTRQLAAQDLGSAPPRAATSAARPAPSVPPRAPTVAVGMKGSVDTQAIGGTERSATAGADYTRSADVAPRPPRPAAPAVVARPAPLPATAPTAPSASGPWRIQLGAFGVAANADALWNKVRARPELVGHPRINAKAGAITKLQAGGFASQAAAKTVCAKLADGGFTCVATLN
jgi:TPR repeat protein